LVWVRWETYLWPQHCDRGIREGGANPCKHIDCSILSEELHQQKSSPLEIWCWSSRIPLGFPNERCASLWHQRKASSSLHWSISYHWQVCNVVLPSGVIVEAIGSSQCVSCQPTQKMFVAPNRSGSWRYHPIKAILDIQGISYQDSGPTESSHSKQDHIVLQG
jgi:hypothetical protein